VNFKIGDFQNAFYNVDFLYQMKVGDQLMVSRNVVFSETDMSGRVHFTQILKYVEDAEHQLMRSKNIKVIEVDGSGWPRVRVECDYKAPLFFENIIEVKVEISAIGNRSMTWDFSIICNKEICASGKMITVYIGSNS
jgi:acyl-CoA thioester hydrolase